MVAGQEGSSFPMLASAFYDRPVELVARELLGRILIHDSPAGRTSGRIVETEAYLATGDSACHSARGRTKRNASMFGPPGRAYVYAIHSRWCFNVVTEPEEVPSAVLIRALEPLIGIPLMQQRRQREKLLELTRGPGRLCQALAIDRALDGCDLTLGETLWIEDPPAELPLPTEIGISPRIGVTSAHELLLRYYVRGNKYVSGKRLP